VQSFANKNEALHWEHYGMTKSEMQAEALANARAGQSAMNYAAIFEGFIAKGIAEADIKPRENVFTYHAWKALGRSVKRGEHGIKVVTFIECSAAERDPASGEVLAPRLEAVFGQPPAYRLVRQARVLGELDHGVGQQFQRPAGASMTGVIWEVGG
jgi:hypothetical protein